MFPEVIFAWILLAANVVVHAVGLTGLIRYLTRVQPEKIVRFWRRAWLLILVACWLILQHLLGIAIWAAFYWLQKCLPDRESAFYFSIVTYTTVGYGDLVLAREWRLLAGVEALNGILMCGLSTGFFFAVTGRFFGLSTKNPSSS
jgi:hypothetical protein